MTMMKLSLPFADETEAAAGLGANRAGRLRSLRAMLVFAAQEAEALGEGQLAAAIEQACRSAEMAACSDMGRTFFHDA